MFILQEVITVIDKDRLIELSLIFDASWNDSRIFRKKNSGERINLRTDKELIFLPDFYIYSLFKLQKTQMFLGSSEIVQLDSNNTLM